MKRDPNFSKKVLALYPQCAFCNQPSTEAHHIVAKGLGGGWGEDVMANGIGLCMKHHRLVTLNKIKLPASVLNDDQIAYIEKIKWKGWRKIDWEN